MIAKNTEALQSGVLYGLASQVDGIVTRMVAESLRRDLSEVTVIATGGLAPLVVEECATSPSTSPGSRCSASTLVFTRNQT